MFARLARAKKEVSINVIQHIIRNILLEIPQIVWWRWSVISSFYYLAGCEDDFSLHFNRNSHPLWLAKEKNTKRSHLICLGKGHIFHGSWLFIIYGHSYINNQLVKNINVTLSKILCTSNVKPTTLSVWISKELWQARNCQETGI